jgi:putative ABC transport system permease protein
MNWWQRLRHRERLERELDAELRYHFDRLVEDGIQSGMSPRQARRHARSAIGPDDQLKERCRDARGTRWVEETFQDVRFGLRLVVKEPWFTSAAIVALALGIAANTTIFTAVNAVLIRDLPFERPDRVVALGTHDTRTPHVPGPQGYRGVSLAEFDVWKNATSSLTAIAAYYQTTMNVSDGEYAAERLVGAYVSANTLQLIGRAPRHGRSLLSEDDRPGAASVVVLGDGIWRRRYGADPSVLGRTIRVNGVSSTIVGIMPPGFGFPLNAELWQPLSSHPLLASYTRGTRLLSLVARLADNATVAQARAELEPLAARLGTEFPETNATIVPTVALWAEQHITPQIRVVFLALMGAVGFVLLIACANVANLLLTRSSRRAGEVSLRMSLGATRGRILRQLLTESLLIALFGGGLGLVLTLLGLQLFNALVGSLGAPPYWIAFRMDASVFAFLAAVCLSTSVIFGLAPALHVSSSRVHALLKDRARSIAGSAHTRRWTSGFIVAQLGLTTVLLAGAAAFGRSFIDVYRFDPGFRTSGLLRMALVLPGTDYRTPEDRAAFAEALDTRLRSVPAITASLTSSPSFAGGDRYAVSLALEAMQPNAPVEAVLVKTVGPSYFDVLERPLVAGRGFGDLDGNEGHEVAIVDERFASRFLPGTSPVGSLIQLSPSTNPDARTIATVVGVAPALPQRTDRPEPVVYLPYRGGALAFSNFHIFVRSERPAADVISAVRDELRNINPDLPLFDVTTFDEWLAFLRSAERVFGTLFGIFAAMALLLATVGLYGVVAYSVLQRTSEIALRVALGATTRDVVWLVMKQGLGQLAFGLALGLAGAHGAGRLLTGVLGIDLTDWMVVLFILVLLAVVAMGACYWPARRVARLDPAVALRCE